MLTTDSPPFTRHARALSHWPALLTRLPPSTHTQIRTRARAHTPARTQHYESAFELDPTNMSFLLNMAAAYFEMGNYEKCRELCNQAVDVGREHHADFTNFAKYECTCVRACVFVWPFGSTTQTSQTSQNMCARVYVLACLRGLFGLPSSSVLGCFPTCIVYPPLACFLVA